MLKRHSLAYIHKPVLGHCLNHHKIGFKSATRMIVSLLPLHVNKHIK